MAEGGGVLTRVAEGVAEHVLVGQDEAGAPAGADSDGAGAPPTLMGAHSSDDAAAAASSGAALRAAL